MKFFTLSVVVAGLASEAAAQIKTVSAVRCFTKLGTSSRAPPIATVNKILTLPVYFTRKSTSTPTATVTPPLILVTSTDTVTVTVTTTDYVDVTIGAATTTISTTAGFQPIESSYPGTGDNPVKRGIQALDTTIDKRQSNKKTCKIVNGKRVFSPAAYPSAVTCAGLVFAVSTKTSIVTAKTTTTVTAPAFTNTEVALTTVTVTTGTQVTNTINIQPTATVYAACAANNIASRVNGIAFNGDAYQMLPGDFDFVTANSAYDCCVACQTYETNNNGRRCSFSSFDDGGCLLGVGVSPGTCSSGGPYDLCDSSDPSCYQAFFSNGCYAISGLGS